MLLPPIPSLVDNTAVYPELGVLKRHKQDRLNAIGRTALKHATHVAYFNVRPPLSSEEIEVSIKSPCKPKIIPTQTSQMHTAKFLDDVNVFKWASRYFPLENDRSFSTLGGSPVDVHLYCQISETDI